MLAVINRRLESLSERSLNIVRHIGWSVVFKLGSIIANFMMVPLSIAYLGAEDYGVWLTLSSVLTWFMLFDIGLGNGLRNKFAEAKALGDDGEAKAFVSTAYYTIAIIGAVLVSAMWLANLVVDWTKVFNTSVEKADELKLLMPVVFGFFGMQLVVKLIVNIYQADQHHSINDKVQFFTQTSTLLAVWLMLQMDKPSLVVFGSVYMALPVMLLMLLNVVSFKGRYNRYKPELASFKKQHLRRIVGLGFRFFIIQIAAIVLFSTDNFIITQLFGPAEVVPYNIAFKYFSIVTLGYGILVAPFWSSFTDAWAKNDMTWVKKTVRNVQMLWLLTIPLALLLMISVADPFYRIWVGIEVAVPKPLTVSMAFFVFIQTFNMIHVQFINGVGKISLQLIVSLVVIFLNIPLSIFLAENVGLGLSGIIIATSICLIIPVFLWRIQYYKLINGKAQGIWNK